MVKIIATQKRTTEDGKEFNVLILQGGIEVLQSQKTGRHYVTARKVNLVCTFDEETAKQMVGSTLPGTIQKQSCVPYDYTTKSGETFKLDYTYVYNAEPITTEEAVFA